MTIASNKLVKIEKAFTLIELLIVLLIMSIVFSFVTIRFVSFMSAHQIQAEQEEINAVLSYAKTQAIINDMPVSVNFDNKGYVIKKLIPDELTVDKDIYIKSAVIKMFKYNASANFQVVVNSTLDEQVLFSEYGLSNPYHIRLIKDE